MNDRTAYFDYAATTFMPESVIDSINQYHKDINVAPNRGGSSISIKANKLFEDSRDHIKNFFTDLDFELIFYPGATYAINAIAYGLEHIIEPMDIILIGPYEHHSNYLPWRELALRKKAVLFEMPLLSNGDINFEYLKEIKERVKIVSYSSVANTNGYTLSIVRLKEIFGDDVIYISDDSQKCAHFRFRKNEMADCNIVNSHKMYGPKSLAGALVNEKFLNHLNPSIFGGGMVERIGFPNIWKSGIQKYEPGSIDVANCIGWKEACKYINEFGFDNIKSLEKQYSSEILEELRKKSKVNIVSVGESTSIVSFWHKDIHAHDIEEIFSNNGIIVRAGHICSQNSIAKFGMKPIVRISLGIGIEDYDVEKIVNVIRGYL